MPACKYTMLLQVFPRMANYTNTHKMTGVGNALKRHYQALCLDYELAHPDDPTKQVGLQTKHMPVCMSACLSKCPVKQPGLHQFFSMCIDAYGAAAKLC